MFGFQPIAFNNNPLQNIYASGCVPVFFPSNPPTQILNVGEFYYHDLNYYNTGGTATTWGYDMLPPGINLSSGGILSGTPDIGFYSSQITAYNECTPIIQILYVDFEIS